jgi:hypothetical protein
MEFIPHKVNPERFSLAVVCSSIDMDKVVKKFYAGLNSNATDDEEKGYGNLQVGFLSEKGTEFYLYTRYRNPRVGCLYENHKDAPLLVDWLTKNNCTLEKHG